MTDYDDDDDSRPGPGPGWRRITGSEYLHERHLGRPTMISETGVPLSGDARKVFWARGEPVPPLPTEPYTMVEVQWRADDTTNYSSWPRQLFCDGKGSYMGAGSGHVFRAEFVQSRITGWKPLALPVADQVEGRDWIGNPDGTLVYWQQQAEQARNELVELRRVTGQVVREAQVPPVPLLPTEPYTAIRASAPNTGVDGLVLILREDGTWWDMRGVAQRTLKHITGFEVLAEPAPLIALYQERERVRRETVKAMARRLRELDNEGFGTTRRIRTQVLHEFAVTDDE